MGGGSYGFVLSVPGTQSSHTDRGDAENTKRLDFFPGVCGGRRARIRERRRLFLARRDCLAFDARSKCSNRAPGCCSRPALSENARASIRGPSLSLSLSLFSSKTRGFIKPAARFYARKQTDNRASLKKKHVNPKYTLAVYAHQMCSAVAA